MAVVDERTDDRRNLLVGEADLADVAHEVLGRKTRHPQLVGGAHDAHDVLAVHAVGHDGAAFQQEIQREALLHPVSSHERDGVALLRLADDRSTVASLGSNPSRRAFHGLLRMSRQAFRTLLFHGNPLL